MKECRLQNERERGCISRSELQLNNMMRLLWEQHVYWTRLVISGIVFDSPDIKQSTARLLRNPGDFADALMPFFGEKEMTKFKELFTSHLTIAAQLVSELKAGERANAMETERRWYENANQIAVFLAGINRYWSMRRWQEMMYNHLNMTKNEAAAFLAKDYAASVSIFDRIEDEALEMADMMTRGIVRQNAIL